MLLHQVHRNQPPVQQQVWQRSHYNTWTNLSNFASETGQNACCPSGRWASSEATRPTSVQGQGRHAAMDVSAPPPHLT